MPTSLSDPKAYHILTYGTLLGSNLFQSFLAGPVAYNALPRPSFSTLQQAIFPPYFIFQTALPLVLALTWPGEKVVISSAAGSAAAGGAAIRYHAAGIAGLLGEEPNRWGALVPIVTMFVTSLANLVVLGPATTRVMRERKHQETRDGKRYYDPGPKTPEMQRLNSSFSKLHGASSLANLIGTGALIYYAFTLAGMM